jgi:hypothetical protein
LAHRKKIVLTLPIWRWMLTFQSNVGMSPVWLVNCCQGLFCLILATINELNVIISLLQFSGVLDWIFIYHQRPLLLTKRSPELTICSWDLPKFSSCKFLQLWDSSKYITTCVSVYNLYKFICIFTGQRYFHIKIFRVLCFVGGITCVVVIGYIVDHDFLSSVFTL